NWAFFDSQIAKYRNSNVSQNKNGILGLVLAAPRFAINWFKVYEPRWRTALAMILLVSILSTIFFVNSALTHAASFTFNQTDWSGGVNAATIVHPTNQSGWTKYSAGSNIDATGTPGSVK